MMAICPLCEQINQTALPFVPGTADPSALAVMQVQFSPDGRWIATASFDKAVKLWDGVKGSFVGTLRCHVGPVYQLAWSSDSRLVVSASKDSTLKVDSPGVWCCISNASPLRA